MDLHSQLLQLGEIVLGLTSSCSSEPRSPPTVRNSGREDDKHRLALPRGWGTPDGKGAYLITLPRDVLNGQGDARA
jgi:hypothetical protein